MENVNLCLENDAALALAHPCCSKCYLHLCSNFNFNLTNFPFQAQKTIFAFVVTGFYNNSQINLYSLSLSMKLTIPKCQRSFTLLTTVCIVGALSLSRAYF